MLKKTAAQGMMGMRLRLNRDLPLMYTDLCHRSGQPIYPKARVGQYGGHSDFSSAGHRDLHSPTTAVIGFSLAGAALLMVGMLAATTPASAQGLGRRYHESRQPRIEKDQSNSDGGERFTLADGGRTVHDNLLKVTWLLNANVGKGACKNVPSVGTGGGMNWKTAWACVAQVNSGTGLLGHTNWQMPASPVTDRSCSAVGPQGNSFARNCRGSTYGSLYYDAWKRHFGDTVALQVGPTIGGFSNLQPTLYWFGNSLQRESGKKKRNRYNGFNSFSFSNGWQGANVNHHVIYFLPIIAGPVPAGSPAARATIWDPAAESGVPGKSGISWLADANVAHDPQFLQQVKAEHLPISSNGSMDQKTAQKLIELMRKNEYLGRNDWMLPVASDTNCTINGKTNKTAGHHCTVSGMGHLYYDILKLKAGTAVAEPPDISDVKPFVNVQPSLYWACAADPSTQSNPQGNLCSPTPTAASGFGFSFDMGSGFTDTTLLGSDLYLMVYYSDPQAN